MGSKLAAVSMDARSAKASNLLRKVVVSRLHEMSVADFNELLANGAGAVLFLLPPEGAAVTEEMRRMTFQMEEHLLTSEIEVPVYFAYENDQLGELVETLDRDTSAGAAGQKVSAAESKCPQNTKKTGNYSPS